MAYHETLLKMATDYGDEDIKSAIIKEMKRDSGRLSDEQFTFEILNKSLDARKKSDIHWLIRVAVISGDSGKSASNLNSNENGKPDNSLNYDLNGNHETYLPKKSSLYIPCRKRGKKVIVAGSGPAGFFAAYVLQKSGFNATIIERGSEVNRREIAIKEFESTGKFNSVTNYAFGEGGAGTFSDGKLTSRSKHISKEREFVLSSYVEAGAPKEILYMAHPHLGSDHLKQIVKNLRKSFINIGGTILFETMVNDLKIDGNGKVEGVSISSTTPCNYAGSSIDNRIDAKNKAVVNGEIGADEVIIAPGHSSYETYRMLMSKGVIFKTKNFAIGCRVEHPQELINIAQWGKKSLPGVKAAEYRLTSRGDGRLPVYTFCMCPGGVVVPSTAYKNANIVNGMSRYQRNGKFANAACVAGVNPDRLILDSGAAGVLDWLESLEHDFYRYSGGYAAPFCSIQNFIDKKLGGNRANPNEISYSNSDNNVESSYPLGLKLAPLWELLPVEVASAIRAGLEDFSRKIRNFETGLIMGLESKTSAPVVAVREKNFCCTGFENLYMAGEGSGHSGGIISSASDGIRVAMSIIM